MVDEFGRLRARSMSRSPSPERHTPEPQDVPDVFKESASYVMAMRVGGICVVGVIPFHDEQILLFWSLFYRFYHRIALFAFYAEVYCNDS